MRKKMIIAYLTNRYGKFAKHIVFEETSDNGDDCPENEHENAEFLVEFPFIDNK